MKSLCNYIIGESASLFSDMYYTGGHVIAYIKHMDGDKTFGDVKSGDKLYVYYYTLDKVQEVTATSGVISRSEKKYIKIDSIIKSTNKFGKKYKIDKLDFGPSYGGLAGGDKSYDPDQVEASSICVMLDKSMVFGTNKDNVLKFAKSSIGEQIEEISQDIDRLNGQISSLKTKLDNLE